jgi:hypothetical protein
MGGAVRVQEAALNNAEWCDAFCRAHGIAGRFEADAWSSAQRTPPLYSDAVALVAGCSAARLVSRVDTSPGCSIKDSFADLDLSASGFEVLFTAEWLCLDQDPRRNVSEGWLPVAGGEELERWEAAWGESPEPRFFRRELLADARIKFLARPDGARLRAGAIANRSRSVIGLSNLFDVEGDLESAWSEGASAAQAVWGPMPVVGYGRGESLEAARRAGFETIATLTVWIAR